jgi:hypothetical protein
MTRNLRALARWRRARPAVLVTVVFALAWMLQLWLLVLGCVAAAVVLVRFYRRYRTTVLPAVVAGTAATRAPGASPPIAVEAWAAMWLAVMSGGRAEWLCRAARLVARTETDPWAARVAIMRLEAAEQAVTQGRVLGLCPLSRIAPGWRGGVWGALAVVLLALAHTDGTWWLVPTAAALAGTADGLTELQESRSAPRLLAREALAAPSRWGDGEATRLELALLAGGDARVLRKSRQLVETAPWVIPHRQAAVRKLIAAEAMTVDDAVRLRQAPDDGPPVV